MRRAIQFGLALLLLAVLATARVVPLAAQSSGGGDVAIVVHEKVAVKDLPLTELRKIFRGERQYWTTDLPVVLLVRAPTAHERSVVLRVVYQMTEAQYKQFWVAKVFRAEAVSVPKLVYSGEMTTQMVASLPGAISFVEARQAGSGVKTIRVDGKLPGEAAYPLR
jgi:ABC-type phosphate transport system substrate-binding protein